MHVKLSDSPDTKIDSALPSSRERRASFLITLSLDARDLESSPWPLPRCIYFHAVARGRATNNRSAPGFPRARAAGTRCSCDHAGIVYATRRCSSDGVFSIYFCRKRGQERERRWRKVGCGNKVQGRFLLFFFIFGGVYLLEILECCVITMLMVWD